ncbi:MAG: gluconate 2-dehydrogenase subunit 3 family protein [Acidobacteriota bacterium]
MSQKTPGRSLAAKRRRPTRRGVLAAGVGAAAAAALPVQTASAAVDWQPKFFTPEQGAMLQVLCDLILPKTSTPSATEAGVHEYIDEALSVAEADEQLAFLGGLAWLDDRARGSSFVALADAEQVSLLEEISDERTPTAETRAGAAFFSDLKERVLFGYYTSKTGRQVLGKPDGVRREKLKGC